MAASCGLLVFGFARGGARVLTWEGVGETSSFFHFSGAGERERERETKNEKRSFAWDDLTSCPLGQVHLRCVPPTYESFQTFRVMSKSKSGCEDLTRFGSEAVTGVEHNLKETRAGGQASQFDKPCVKMLIYH